jgi:hypothetical protein
MFRKRKLAALPKIDLITPHDWPGGFPRQNPNREYTELCVRRPRSFARRPMSETVIVPVTAPSEQACDCPS